MIYIPIALSVIFCYLWLKERHKRKEQVAILEALMHSQGRRVKNTLERTGTKYVYVDEDILAMLNKSENKLG